MRNTWLLIAGMAACIAAASCVVHTQGAEPATPAPPPATTAPPAATVAPPAATVALPTPATTTPPATTGPTVLPIGRHPGGNAAKACPNVVGDAKVIRLPEGTCQGNLVITGNGNQVLGAGIGKSFVSGALTMTGNNNQLHGVSVTGPCAISGTKNDATGNELGGQVIVTGTDNKR